MNHCSFCNRPETNTRFLIESPVRTVTIRGKKTKQEPARICVRCVSNCDVMLLAKGADIRELREAEQADTRRTPP